MVGAPHGPLLPSLPTPAVTFEPHGQNSDTKYRGPHLFVEKLLHTNVQRFRGGLVFKAHRLCVSLNSRLESKKEE